MDIPAFTPGPWEIAPHSDTDELLEVVANFKALPNGIQQAHWIAQCDAAYDPDTDVWEESLAINNANAHLIAAAPDLYAALMELTEAYRELAEMNDMGLAQYGSEMTAADRALAKAQGHKESA